MVINVQLIAYALVLFIALEITSSVFGSGSNRALRHGDLVCHSWRRQIAIAARTWHHDAPGTHVS